MGNTLKIKKLSIVEWFNSKKKFITVDIDPDAEFGIMLIWDGYWITDAFALTGSIENMEERIWQSQSFHEIDSSQVLISVKPSSPEAIIHSSKFDPSRYKDAASQIHDMAKRDIESGKIQFSMDPGKTIKTPYGEISMAELFDKELPAFDTLKEADGIISYEPNRNLPYRPSFIHAIAIREVFAIKY